MLSTVRDLMTADVVSVSPETPLKEAARLMAEHRVSALPVVDRDGRLLGVVSESDLMVKEQGQDEAGVRVLDWLAGGERSRKAAARDAEGAMTIPVVTISPEATIADAARSLQRARVHRLFVTEGDRRLIGVLSRADLLKPFLRPDAELEAEVVRNLRILAVDPREVAVAVKDGNVRLSGEVETRSLAEMAAALAGSVSGVVSVDLAVSWRLDDSRLRAPSPEQADRLAASER
jgi:CBS domain-containing protein